MLHAILVTQRTLHQLRLWIRLTLSWNIFSAQLLLSSRNMTSVLHWYCWKWRIDHIQCAQILNSNKYSKYLKNLFEGGARSHAHTRMHAQTQLAP